MRKIDLPYILAGISKYFKIDIKEFKLIGEGSYGFAYTHPKFKDKVLKLTRDTSEVHDSKTIKKLRPEWYVKIYNIYELHSQWLDDSNYLIIKELIVPLKGEELSCVSQANNIYFLKLKPNERKHIDTVKNAFQSDYYITKWKNWERYTNQYLKLIQEVGNQINTMDLHGGNIGYRPDNRTTYVIFDNGANPDRGVDVKNQIKLESKNK